jgi:uncharacterized membrane protein
MIPAFAVIHVLAAVTWVGGMFFAYMVLRPACLSLEPAQRLALWHAVFSRFFVWVWIFVGILLGSGHGLLGLGVGQGSPPVAAMAAIGWAMALLYAYLYFRPFQALRRAVALGDTPAAARAMAGIRPIVAINLALGLVTCALGALSHFWG